MLGLVLREHAFEEAADAEGSQTIATVCHALRICRDDVLVWTVTDANAIARSRITSASRLDALKKAISAPSRMMVDWVRLYQR